MKVGTTGTTTARAGTSLLAPLPLGIALTGAFCLYLVASSLTSAGTTTNGYNPGTDAGAGDDSGGRHPWEPRARQPVRVVAHAFGRAPVPPAAARRRWPATNDARGKEPEPEEATASAPVSVVQPTRGHVRKPTKAPHTQPTFWWNRGVVRFGAAPSVPCDAAVKVHVSSQEQSLSAVLLTTRALGRATRWDGRHALATA